MIGSKVMATLPDWADLPSDGVLSGKVTYERKVWLIKKEAIEWTYSEEEANLYDPDPEKLISRWSWRWILRSQMT